MSWVKVRDGHGDEHLITKAALETTFAGHGFVLVDKPAPKRSPKKTQGQGVSAAPEKKQ